MRHAQGAKELRETRRYERRWKRLGFSIKGRVLVVVYTLRTLKNGTETIRIISARQASKKERKAYAG